MLLCAYRAARAANLVADVPVAFGGASANERISQPVSLTGGDVWRPLGDVRRRVARKYLRLEPVEQSVLFHVRAHEKRTARLPRRVNSTSRSSPGATGIAVTMDPVIRIIPALSDPPYWPILFAINA